ncbi:DUF6894 family protein [Methylobacterium brachythecii]|uniref:PDZ domain-containing secreted protein n=1 Tax=Methylobacterium brachythecii TaxID=1176177 RepID=A0A7W6AMW2_9HYPH|nr:hypothetical protein [Methylobacterium brachythecii]MBB3905533.1 PDZ domain-containing secreted protein [Methylobacterium brachythecii]GLS46258.1 hypothetical protein GCM10007884_42500 [Methylobacterium brachythecii]
MTNFFFDVHDGISVRDDIGRQLPDIEAARREAIQIAAKYAKDPENLGAGGLLVVSVRNTGDAVVLTIRLVCQIEVAG